MGIEGFLLIDDVLELDEQRRVEEAWQFGQRDEQSHCLLQVHIPIDVFFVKLLHHDLLKLRTGDVAKGEGEENAGEGSGLLAVEGTNPFDCNGCNDGVEVVVNGQVIVADLVEDGSNVIVSEEFKVFFDEDGEVFAAQGSLNFRLEMVVLGERDLITLRHHDHVLLFLRGEHPLSLQTQ